MFYQKFTCYVPREIIINEVLDELKGQIDEDFFDAFTFLDNKQDSGCFDNENTLEVNTLLQQSIFKLLERSKTEFLIFIEEYYEHLKFKRSFFSYLKDLCNYFGTFIELRKQLKRFRRKYRF